MGPGFSILTLTPEAAERLSRLSNGSNISIQIQAKDTPRYSYNAVGVLPGHPNVVVASPCSGHGFKFSCLIGRVLADLAVDGETSIAIDTWRLG